MQFERRDDLNRMARLEVENPAAYFTLALELRHSMASAQPWDSRLRQRLGVDRIGAIRCRELDLAIHELSDLGEHS